MDRRTFLAFLLPSTAAVAQLPPGAYRIAPTLSGILPSARWMPGAAQILLVIGGKQATALPEPDYDTEDRMYRQYYNQLRQETLAQLGPEPPEGYSLAAVAAAFGRKVTRFGQVAALVPTSRKALVLTPGAPRPTPLERVGSVYPLLDRLDDTQVKTLLSEAGLGRDELPESLRPLFDLAIPRNLYITRRPDDTLVARVEGSQRQTMRLRLSLISNVSVRADKQQIGSLVFQGGLVPLGSVFPTEGLRLGTEPGQVATPVPRTIYGQQLVRTAAAALIPEKLPLPCENRTISLEGVSTLGKLTARLGEAEGWELVVPPAQAEWSVEWRGASEVSSGDVLHALLATVNGTIRPVGKRYVLSDSQEALGPHLERLCQWMNRGGADPKLAPRREFLPLTWGRFEESDPCPLPTELLEVLSNSESYEGILVPRKEFAKYPMIERLLEPHLTSNPAFAPTHVRLQVNWMTHLVIPGVGAVPHEQVFLPARKKQPPPPTTLSLKQTWPILRVATAEEAKRAVAWAKQQGAPGVVLEGPGTALTAAIAERVLPVRRVHRLWKAIPGDPETLRERTIQGRVSSEWLSPTHPDALLLAQKRLQETVLTELDGVLVYDAVPPGYRGYGNDTDGLTLLGYTDRNREAFLTKHNRDILDIAPGSIYHPLWGYRPWV